MWEDIETLNGFPVPENSLTAEVFKDGRAPDSGQDALWSHSQNHSEMESQNSGEQPRLLQHVCATRAPATLPENRVRHWVSRCSRSTFSFLCAGHGAVLWRCRGGQNQTPYLPLGAYCVRGLEGVDMNPIFACTNRTTQPMRTVRGRPLVLWGPTTAGPGLGRGQGELSWGAVLEIGCKEGVGVIEINRRNSVPG